MIIQKLMSWKVTWYKSDDRAGTAAVREIVVRSLPFLKSYVEIWNRVLRDDSDGLARSRSGILHSQIAMSILGIITTGTFFTALLLAILKDATTEQYAYFIALQATVQHLSAAAQLIAPLFLEKMKKRRIFVNLFSGFFYAAHIIFLPMLTVLPMTVSQKGYAFVVLTALMGIANALTAPAVGVWELHSLPDRCRSDFYVLKAGLAGILRVTLLFIFSLFLDFFTANGAALGALLALHALGIPLLCWFFMGRNRMVEPEYTSGTQQVRIRDIVAAPFAVPSFLIAVGIIVVFQLAQCAGATYYSAYLLDGANLSYTYLSIVNICALPATLLTYPIWNKMIHRFGWLPVMGISTFFFATCHAINCFVTEDTQWMYIVSGVYCQIIGGGYTLGVANLPYMFMPKKLRSSCLAFYNISSAVAAAVGAWLSKYIFAATEGKIWHVFGLAIENRAYMSFIPAGVIALEAIVIFLIGRKYKNGTEAL